MKLQRIDRADHKAAIAHGDAFGSSAPDAVYDAVIPHDYLADVVTAQFADDRSGFR